MDFTPELVETLRAGHRVKLILAPNEPVQNAHALFNRMEREHDLRIGRQPHIVNGVIYFIVWSQEHLVPPTVKADA